MSALHFPAVDIVYSYHRLIEKLIYTSKSRSQVMINTNTSWRRWNETTKWRVWTCGQRHDRSTGAGPAILGCRTCQVRCVPRQPDLDCHWLSKSWFTLPQLVKISKKTGSFAMKTKWNKKMSDLDITGKARPAPMAECRTCRGLNHERDQFKFKINSAFSMLSSGLRVYQPEFDCEWLYVCSTKSLWTKQGTFLFRKYNGIAGTILEKRSSNYFL